MRRLTALVSLAALLAVASNAAAGGWASVTLETTPTGIGAGETWDAQITVLRHGLTPTDGARPSVTIRNAAGEERVFEAEPTGKTGVYAAEVVFPDSGEWRYSVNDGLAATGYGISQVTEYPPVTVTGSSGGDGVSFPVGPVLVACAAALAVCAAVYAGFRRQRRLTPASR